MNTNSKTVFRTSAVAVLAILLMFSIATPAAAARRGDSHGSRSSGRSGHSSRRSSRHHDRRDSGLRIGFGLTNRVYSTTTIRHYVPGYYQNSTQQVLVEPAHYAMQTHHVQVEPGRYEIRTVPAVEKTVRDENGKEHNIILAPARTETVYIPPRYEQQLVRAWVPDRYETRTTQVWVPGHWVSQPSYSYSGPRSWINIGGVFRF